MLVVSHGCGNGLGRTGVAVGTVGSPVDVEAEVPVVEEAEETEREVGKAIVEAAVIAEAVVVVSSLPSEDESEPEPESCRRMCWCWCGECVEDHNRR